MRRSRLLFALGLLVSGLGLLTVGPTVSPAHAAADGLFITCDTTGQTGQSLDCNVAATDSADDETDDETYRGTISFTSTINNDFTVTPHDAGAGNEKKYTFKAGDLVDGAADGKDFTIVFNSPGSGTISVGATGLPDAESEDIVVSGAVITTTTTSTTAAPVTTTTTVAGATTTTAAAVATTTTVKAATTTTVRSGALPATTANTGSNSGRDAKIAGGLLVLGAALLVAASRRTMRARGDHFAS